MNGKIYGWKKSKSSRLRPSLEYFKNSNTCDFLRFWSLCCYPSVVTLCCDPIVCKSIRTFGFYPTKPHSRYFYLIEVWWMRIILKNSPRDSGWLSQAIVNPHIPWRVTQNSRSYLFRLCSLYCALIVSHLLSLECEFTRHYTRFY